MLSGLGAAGVGVAVAGADGAGVVFAVVVAAGAVAVGGVIVAGVVVEAAAGAVLAAGVTEMGVVTGVAGFELKLKVGVLDAAGKLNEGVVEVVAEVVAGVVAGVEAKLNVVETNAGATEGVDEEPNAGVVADPKAGVVVDPKAGVEPNEVVEVEPKLNDDEELNAGVVVLKLKVGRAEDVTAGAVEEVPVNAVAGAVTVGKAYPAVNDGGNCAAGKAGAVVEAAGAVVAAEVDEESGVVLGKENLGIELEEVNAGTAVGVAAVVVGLADDAEPNDVLPKLNEEDDPKLNEEEEVLAEAGAGAKENAEAAAAAAMGAAFCCGRFT